MFALSEAAWPAAVELSLAFKVFSAVEKAHQEERWVWHFRLGHSVVRIMHALGDGCERGA